jgi:hypothetical protein
MIQNAGYGLNAKKVGSSFSVEVVSVTEYSQQQSWNFRSSGHIVHREFDQCLYRMGDGKIGLIGCGDGQVSTWEVDFQKGVYTERSSKQVLYMDQKTVITKEVTDRSGDKGMSSWSWSTYQMVSREEYKPPTIIKVRPKASEILSIQNNGMFLVAEMSNNALSLTVTKQPPELQFQAWTILENGRIKNVQYNQCLTVSQSSGAQTVSFTSCESQSAGVWEYKFELGVIVEKDLKQCLSVQNDKVSLSSYADGTVQPSQKWDAYGTAQKVPNDKATAATAYSGNAVAVVAAIVAVYNSLH